MIVVKLGGSLYQKPELKNWLNELSTLARQQPVVIVPGGGPFADQVRSAQQQHLFSDQCAHHMAILAMAQFGILLTGIEPDCQPLYFPADTADISNQLYVWLPDKHLLSQAELNHSWDITSDSLALWLARQLVAEQLVIVKNCLTTPDTSFRELSRQGILDAGFARLFADMPVPTQIIPAHNFHTLSERLDDTTMAMT